MRFESNADVLLAKPRQAFEAAVDDVVTLARAHAARNSRTGEFERSITRSETVDSGDRLEARVGSPLSSAKAKEKGAFIQAKRGRYLVFNAGDGVRKKESVRLRPQPAVTPAGQQFRSQLMPARLRELGVR